MGSTTTSKLEVIEKGRRSGSHPVPLVFVHGALQAAWCWDENFLDFFAGHGYRAVALSLRRHGPSPSSKPVRSCSIADYVASKTALAQRRHASGESVNTISAALEVSRATVYRVLAAQHAS